MITLNQLFYEDLLENPNEPRTLISALISGFDFETAILPILHENVPAIVCVHGERHGKIDKLGKVTLISPRIDVFWGKFNAKYFLLKFPQKLRVVVTSANATPNDFENYVNTIWF